MKQKNILLFNARAFGPITLHWMAVCCIRITKQTKEAYALRFKLMFDRCMKDNQFVVGKTLLDVVIDWSDSEAECLKLRVGEKNSKSVVERLQITLDTFLTKSSGQSLQTSTP